jgi:predicted nucleotidyltransferase component of viral defense system
MREIARRPEKDRREPFTATAETMNVRSVITEKDFWVCWVLDYLFCDSQWKDKMIFKGGTSLSKAFGAIQRFSEDVDLILDWSLLGSSEAEAFRTRSRKKQAEFGQEARNRTIQFLKESFVPALQNNLRDRLGGDGDIVVAQEKQQVFIEYPKSFSDEAIRPRIVLEIGPKALQEPNEQKEICSYAAEKYPSIFTMPSTVVRTVSAERTFWEKATILHKEAHRAPDKTLPSHYSRYSRHYYDLYRLSQTPILDKALKRIDLLQNVADFKDKFFHCAWARYEEAKPGTLALLPLNKHVDELEKDYQSMRAMLFGTVPSFDDILGGLAALEKEINSRGETL